MKHLLLLIEHRKNCHLLSQWLREQYQILSPTTEGDFAVEGEQLLAQTFDLCFIDFGAIRKLRQQMLAKRQAEIPTFLPFVFLTTLQDIGFSTDHLESLIDDIIYIPIQKIELETKLRVLLRSRSSSLQLQAAQAELNQALAEEKELNQLKTRFVSMVSHEFRNPLNGISGMTQILQAYGELNFKDALGEEKPFRVRLGRQAFEFLDRRLKDNVNCWHKEQRQKQNTLTSVLEKAGDAYKRGLKESPRAIEYLKGRGLSGEIAKQFGLGYAPEGWRSLASVFPNYDDPLL
ncbi:MAG: hypothetical protein RLZZ69_3814, partial [Cyanobacteriota bacterium]